MRREQSPNENTRIGALLLHGLTSSPGEVEPLKNFLESRGVICRAPLLPGHGTTIKDLGWTSHHAWLDCVERELSLLLNQTDQTFIIGESLGALLGLIVAAQHNISGIVALSIPYKIATHHRLLYLLSLLPDSVLGYLGTRPKRPRPEGTLRHPYENYPAHHLGAGARLLKLRRMLDRRIGDIKCSVLLLQDPDDDHIQSDSSQALAQKLSHASVELYLGGSHQLLCGRFAPEIFNRVETFITASQNT